MKEKQTEKAGGASGEAYIVNIKSPTYERAVYLSFSISSPLCSLHFQTTMMAASILHIQFVVK